MKMSNNLVKIDDHSFFKQSDMVYTKACLKGVMSCTESGRSIQLEGKKRK